MDPHRTPRRSGQRPAPPHPEPAWDVDLRTCPFCLSRLTQLVEEHTCDEGCAVVERRCPECEWRDVEHVDGGSVTAFREHADAARGELVALLYALEARTD
jgi:hypothetical protein